MIDNNGQNNEGLRVNQIDRINNKVNELVDAGDKKEREKGKGTFYGILAFAVFIIMAVGATFAYFTASTNSATGSVRTGSASLQLDYISYTSAWLNDELIPVATNIVEYSVEQRPDSSGHKMCIDDNGSEICSAYVFQVRNKADAPQNVSIKIASDENGFANLNAMIYEVSKGSGYSETVATDDPVLATNQTEYDKVCVTDPEAEGYDPACSEFVKVQDANGVGVFDYTPIYINRLGVTKTLLSVESVKSVAVPVPQVGEEDARLATNVELPGLSAGSGNNVKTFLVVLYIKETGGNQTDVDSSSQFSGRIIVDGSDGSTGVTGKIDATDNSVLQNQTTTTTTDTTDTTTTEGTTTEP